MSIPYQMLGFSIIYFGLKFFHAGVLTRLSKRVTSNGELASTYVVCRNNFESRLC